MFRLMALVELHKSHEALGRQTAEMRSEHERHTAKAGPTEDDRRSADPAQLHRHLSQAVIDRAIPTRRIVRSDRVRQR